MNIKHYNFHLFDGDGGDGGSGDGLGAEASAFMASLGGSQSAAASEPETGRVEYGLPSGDDQQGNVGGSQEQAPDLGAEFAELIGKGGKYHDIYGQHVAQAVQNRFKNSADYQAQVGQYNEALSPLYMKYGLTPGDVEGLSQSIRGDMDIYTSAAERQGISPEAFMEQLNLKAQAKRGQMLEAEYQRQQQRNQRYSEWEAQSQELRTAFPNFDLGQEINGNEEFALLLDNGVDVRRAFMTTHMDEILQGMNQETSRQAQQQTLRNIQQRQARPMENALRTTPAVTRKTDPSKLSNKDMDEIFRRVQEGEVFRF